MNLRSRSAVTAILALFALLLMSTAASASPTVSPGDLIVNTEDENGSSLPSVCFDVFQDGGAEGLGPYLLSRCDQEDGDNDGITKISGLDTGGYILILAQAPGDYIVGGVTTVNVSTSEVNTVSIPVSPGGATLTLLVRDANGAPVPGRCFAVNRSFLSANGYPVTGSCGGNNAVVEIFGLGSGAFTLYSADGGPEIEREVSIDGAMNDVTITVAPEQPSLIEQLIAVLIAILQQILGV